MSHVIVDEPGVVFVDRSVATSLTRSSVRATGRRTPAQAYTALPKATPSSALTEPEWRPRVDRVDKNGKVSLRYAGQLRHLGYGRAHAGRHVLILVHDDHAVTSDATTGEIIAEHRIDPARDYQPKFPRTHSTPARRPDSHPSVNPRKKT